MTDTVPPWLATAFPGRRWESLCSCTLRVDPDAGAGLDLDATDLGYVVDGVDDRPGQAPELRVGAVIVAIEGKVLLGLSSQGLEAAFESEFRDGAALVILDAEELRHVMADSTARSPGEESLADEVLEHGSVVRVPLGTAGWQCLDAPGHASFARDLETFGRKMEIRTELHRPEGGSAPHVVVCGAPEEVRRARGELGALLQHYGLGAPERVEVDGLTMTSLPARHRRVRQPPCAGGSEDGPPATDSLAGPLTGADEPEQCEDVAMHETDVRQYEYLDHTADVILHSWGRTLAESFEQVCVCFFSYMSDLDTVDMTDSVEVEASGRDRTDLLFHLLDEFLFSFGTEFLLCRRVQILELDEANLRVRAKGFGERFDLKKHPQGTEIKAITMHQMKILTPDTMTTEEGTVSRSDDAPVREGCPFECYVLVDI